MKVIKEYIRKKRLQSKLKKLDSYWMRYNGTCFSELPSFYLTHTPEEIEEYYQRLHKKINELNS